MDSRSARVLVVFADSLGPQALARAKGFMPWINHSWQLQGELGYSSGALATLLTGATPTEHGRMCLFEQYRGSGQGPLAPLQVLGFLPKIVHERAALRRRLASAFASIQGMTGYFALHRVPPEHFQWLDVAEREDIFEADTIGGQSTFLTRARKAGLSVYTTPWQHNEGTRWQQALAQSRKQAADLTFVYSANLDAVQHTHGPNSSEVDQALYQLGNQISQMREAVASDGRDVVTLLVGDHGMSEVNRAVDPRPFTKNLSGVRYFVDSTMIRFWGNVSELGAARKVIENMRAGYWLDSQALDDRQCPTKTGASGQAMYLAEEGTIFSPSFVGGVVRGMHGYDTNTASSRAALASDVSLGAVNSIRDVSSVISSKLGIVS